MFNNSGLCFPPPPFFFLFLTGFLTGKFRPENPGSTMPLSNLLSSLMLIHVLRAALSSSCFKVTSLWETTSSVRKQKHTNQNILPESFSLESLLDV